ncbi:hypothetical protein [Duganella sp. Dugasp56]|uniref:hypothetical protein n=1 Tax=Duganella sp. Dugasp56 TaxID=3243046 RepID=UPI0039B025F2
MKNLIGVIAVVLTAILAGWGGYTFGSKNLGAVRAELDDVKKKAAQLQVLVDNSQKRLDEALAKLDREHAAKIKEIQRNAEIQRKELEASLAKAEERIKKKETEISAVKDARAKIAEDLKTAKGDAKAALQMKDKDLAFLQKKLEEAKAGLVCLSAKVPAAEIETLNKPLQ